MKNKIKKIVAVVLIVIIAAAGVLLWHNSEMKNLSSTLREEMEKEALMDKRIEDIQAKLSASEEEKKSLIEQLNELLIKEEAVFDAEAFAEEVRNIGELATIEYRFTNVGAMDSKKTFSLINIEVPVPFSGKTAVVSMDGVIKVGVDVTKVAIKADEVAKTIIVSLPQAEILSNELDEDTLNVYVEKGDITLEESSAIRNEIKEGARQNAKKSGLLAQAHANAEDIIRCLINSIPGIKDTYTVTFK